MQGTCWVCDTRVSDGDNYCRVCGAQLQSTCWVCGGIVKPHDEYCPACNTQIQRDRGLKTPGYTGRTTYRTIVGIFLATLGVIVSVPSFFMNIVPMVVFGMACFLIGFMTLYLSESGAISSVLTTASIVPSLTNIERLLEELDLDGRGIYIPASGLGICPKVFVPLAVTPATKRPPIALNGSRRIFVTVGRNPEERGLLLEAPGSQILETIERVQHIDLSKVQLDDLAANLTSGFKALGIAIEAKLEQKDASITIQIILSSLLELELRLRYAAPRVVAQIGTPVASAAAAAVSKATGKYVTFGHAVFDPATKTVGMTLKTGM
jgi:Double zinc ribbon